MDFTIILAFLALVTFSNSAILPQTLTQGSSLSLQNTLLSPNGLFTAGFYSVGPNAYSFAVWFSEPLSDGSFTAAWMANRDMPVNSKYSKLSLHKTGNLVLHDAGGLLVWATGTEISSGSVQLRLNDTGNLLLVKSDRGILWQSFDSPTDTLLPDQTFTKHMELVSSRSLTNYSSGFYKLYYDNDNVLSLLYDGPEVTSVYWPNPGVRAWDAGRRTYDAERTARLNSSGHFSSTDLLSFESSDYGEGIVRRLTMDVDGNLRLYSLDSSRRNWYVSWQALAQPCLIHGVCGENATCTYDPLSGRKCSCLPKHTMINHTDWSYGCKPDFEPSLCGNNNVDFNYLPHIQFYSFDAEYHPNLTLDECKHKCLNNCDCKGFQYQYDDANGYNLCYIKSRMFTGKVLENYKALMYFKLPRDTATVTATQETGLQCSTRGGPQVIQLERVYKEKQESHYIKFMLWFAVVIGVIEIILIIIFSYYMQKSSLGSSIHQGYTQAATNWRRFSYSELKKVSENFKEEIGRGGGGVVYKGKLPDNRVVAIKHLKQADMERGETEFLAEASTIGRVNHMNLLEIVGFCAEQKHRLLVYEFVEHGSLAENLAMGTLDWGKRYNIALGTARGLAYLHEECLDWVLHCDVKPQNILLDANFQAKVGDFGLSKLLERHGINNPRFSTMRGTRGYMAPEWVFNLPITSKVDVYSYGMVVLEMITGKGPNDGGGMETRLVSWVREKMEKVNWMEEIVDPMIRDECDKCMMENVAKVALLCVEENSNARPTMSQVVMMLLQPEIDYR